MQECTKALRHLHPHKCWNQSLSRTKHSPGWLTLVQSFWSWSQGNLALIGVYASRCCNILDSQHLLLCSFADLSNWHACSTAPSEAIRKIHAEHAAYSNKCSTLSWKQSVRSSSVQLTMVSKLCLCSMADMNMYICMHGNLSLALMLQGCVGKLLAMVETRVLMACWIQSLVICTRSGPC